jgi:hypothetical protein
MHDYVWQQIWNCLGVCLNRSGHSEMAQRAYRWALSRGALAGSTQIEPALEQMICQNAAGACNER